MEENTQVKKEEAGNTGKRTAKRRKEMEEICQDRISAAGCRFPDSLFL